MTPKEKAAELLNKMFDYLNFHTDADVYYAKKCALIAAEEVYKETSNKHFIIGRNGLSGKEYWEQVKQEIEKL